MGASRKLKSIKVSSANRGGRCTSCFLCYGKYHLDEFHVALKDGKKVFLCDSCFEAIKNAKAKRVE